MMEPGARGPQDRSNCTPLCNAKGVVGTRPDWNSDALFAALREALEKLEQWKAAEFDVGGR